MDAEAGSLATDFDGRRVEYNPGQLDGISLAYATTIHNSQGLEYAAIVVVIAIQHYPLLQR